MSVKHCRLLSETFSLKQHLDSQVSPATKDNILLLPLLPAAMARRHPHALGKGTAPSPSQGRSSARQPRLSRWHWHPLVWLRACLYPSADLDLITIHEVLI